MRKVAKFIISSLWAIVLIYFVYITAFYKVKYERAYYLVIFVAILFLSVQEGALSQLLSNKVFYVFCQCSYAIYMMQFPCFHYLKKMISWGWLDWADPFGMVIFGVSLCIVVGLATHLLIELPVGKWLNRRMEELSNGKREN